MNVCLVTGSLGLIGFESVNFFSKQFDLIIGIDNDLRSFFFGADSSNQTKLRSLKEIQNYLHYSIDIRDEDEINKIFKKYSHDIKLVIHTAAQPSHDWSEKDPITDFTINALGTLNLLEATRNNCADAVFIFTSTNKVYGDTPNKIDLIELESRFEVDDNSVFYEGIDEEMSIDHSIHSVFGCSKVSADILCQEYGKNFNMKVGVFRGGCLTGSNHQGAELHGFLSYLGKCVLKSIPYTIYGYKGKQVRDNIHSFDLINMFSHFYNKPRLGEVYNVGGSRHSNCSILEAIKKFECLSNKKSIIKFSNKSRVGDHIWYISNVNKFKSHYPKWKYKYNLDMILEDIITNI